MVVGCIVATIVDDVLSVQSSWCAEAEHCKLDLRTTYCIRYVVGISSPTRLHVEGEDAYSGSEHVAAASEGFTVHLQNVCGTHLAI